MALIGNAISVELSATKPHSYKTAFQFEFGLRHKVQAHTENIFVLAFLATAFYYVKEKFWISLFLSNLLTAEYSYATT